MTETSERNILIRFLSFEGCPGIEPMLKRPRAVIAEEAVEFSIEMVNVPDEQAAHRERFLGSPSIQINGRDIEEDRLSDPSCFGCRLYPNGEPVPPEELKRTAIRRAFDGNGEASQKQTVRKETR